MTPLISLAGMLVNIELKSPPNAEGKTLTQSENQMLGALNQAGTDTVHFGTDLYDLDSEAASRPVARHEWQTFQAECRLLHLLVTRPLRSAPPSRPT